MALCDIFFYFTHAGDAEKSKAVSYNCSELSADLLWLTITMFKKPFFVYPHQYCIDVLLFLLLFNV